MSEGAPHGQEPKRDARPAELRRSRKDKVLGGVFGGLGPYLGIDPVVLRIAWVVLTILSAGVGIVAYVVGWIVIPEAAADADPAGTRASHGNTGPVVLGIVLVALGSYLLLRELIPGLFDLEILGPAILIGVGLAVLFGSFRR